MTAFQIIMASVGISVCLTALGAILWSIYALLTGRETTSGFMAKLPEGVVAVLCLFAGLLIGLLCGHWWWPTVGGG